MNPPRKPSLRSALLSRGKKLVGQPGEFLETKTDFHLCRDTLRCRAVSRALAKSLTVE